VTLVHHPQPLPVLHAIQPIFEHYLQQLHHASQTLGILTTESPWLNLVILHAFNVLTHQQLAHYVPLASTFPPEPAIHANGPAIIALICSLA
jgi:hypothetical protein